jgi:putative ABC transport system permease protein
MNDLLQDLGYAFRALCRSPGFTAVAVLTLALGVGATTAVFSVVNTVLLRPLPFAHQERLTVLWENAEKRHHGLIELSYPNYRDWQSQNKVFEQLAALTSSNAGMNLTGVGEPVQVEAAPVTSNFFATLGVRPELGRVFLPEEDRLGTRHVAVLGHQVWRDLFGGDPRIVGRQIRLDDESYTVTGVMPATFKYPRGAKLWVPLVPVLGAEGTELRIYRVLKAIGRMKPGVTVAQADAAMRVISTRLERQYKQFNEGFFSSVRPLSEEIFGNVRAMLLLLLVGVLFFLLSAVANVANLLLARTLERRHEIGIRAALGASRNRVIRQLLTEGLALGLLGGAGGFVLALVGIDLLTAWAPGTIPRLEEVRMDAATLLFSLGVSVAAVAAFAVAPALQVGRGDLHEPLKEGARRSAGSTKSTHMRKLLVVAEVSLALMLLVGVGLMVQSVIQLQRIDPGFAKENVLTVRIRLPEKRYPEPRQRQAFFDRLLEQTQALPGVVSAATVLARPLDDSAVWEMPVTREGQVWNEPNPLPNYEAVSPDYFRTLKIPLLEGRAFDPHDSETSPLVAIVSRSLAERFWPGQNAVGKRVRRVFGGQQMPWITVVGVVEDVRYRGLNRQMSDFYLPFKQNPLAEYVTYQDLVIHTASDPLALVKPVREMVRALDPSQPIGSAMSLERLVDEALAGPRFLLLLMGIFGGLALCLAAVGIYSLLSYTVNQRSHEIGIRMALGARRRQVLRMVLAQGLKLTSIGLAVGLLASIALTRFMESLLFEVSILDPLTFVSVPIFLATLGLLATSLPAFRATRSDPMKVLRHE